MFWYSIKKNTFATHFTQNFLIKLKCIYAYYSATSKKRADQNR